MKNTFHDPIDFLGAVHRGGVRYLLIGRQAVVAYGGPVQTMDFDVMIDGERDNQQRFLEIAGTFDLSPSVEPGRLRRVFKFKLENDVTIDVFRAKNYRNLEGEKLTFDELYGRRKVVRDPEGLEINLPAIEDLIALKKIRWSEKDREDIRYLERLRERGKH